MGYARDESSLVFETVKVRSDGSKHTKEKQRLGRTNVYVRHSFCLDTGELWSLELFALVTLNDSSEKKNRAEIRLNEIGKQNKRVLT